MLNIDFGKSNPNAACVTDDGSRLDGQPQVVLEALALGVPVLA
jgi:hypothetical protein